MLYCCFLIDFSCVVSVFVLWLIVCFWVGWCYVPYSVGKKWLKWRISAVFDVFFVRCIYFMVCFFAFILNYIVKK